MDPRNRTDAVASSATPGVSAGLDLTGKTLGDFHVLRHLGTGGMGQVYLAEQRSLQRKVALKILRPELAADRTALERFKAEATAVARVPHANIVQVYTVGMEDGIAFMALEYVEGRNLREYLARKGPPELLPALRIMLQVASALQRAGELGIVHRDIKPENILLTRKGEAKVADFGLSRCLAGDQPSPHLTQTGVALGTPLYMSPEQVAGKAVDVRTDIYSFGATCYHMLTGQPPFRGESAFEVALQHVQKEPTPLTSLRPDLPSSLCTIVHKMLAKDPAQRYQTGRELLRDLLRLRESLGGQTAALQPLSSSSLPAVAAPGPAASTLATLLASPSPSSGRRLLITSIVASLLLALTFGVVAGWLRRSTEAESPIPVTRAEEPDPLLSQRQDEQHLRGVVDHYLNAPIDRAEVSAIVGLCIDLGLLYLKQHRLDEAEHLFTRLNTHGHFPQLQMLHLLGRAIVLALQNNPQESNRLFEELFSSRGRPAQKQRLDNIVQSHLVRLSPWVGKAVYYNLANGLPRNKVPSRLLQMYPQP